MISPFRRFLLVFSGILIVLSGGVCLVNYVIDPIEYFRVPTWRTPVYFSGYQRYQNVGLAAHHVYDTVVIGDSLTENFLPSHINRLWQGVKTIKLSISGSSPYEQRLILDQALLTGQVKRVIWGLDQGGFSAAATDQIRVDQGPFPYYMYGKTRTVNIRYLFSFDTLKLSIYALLGHGQLNLDRLDTWYDTAKFGKTEVLRAWPGQCSDFRAKYSDRLSVPDRSIVKMMRQSVNKNVWEVVHSHPEVTYYVFFPPVSTLRYVPANQGYLPDAIAFRRVVVDELSGEPNVRLFDFAPATHLTDDLDNYRDLIHYDLRVTDFIIDAMRDDLYRVGRAQLETIIANLVAHVEAFDLCDRG